MPTLIPAATQKSPLAVSLCLAYLLLIRMRTCFLLFFYRDLMRAVVTVLNMLEVVVRSAELVSTSYLMGNYHTSVAYTRIAKRTKSKNRMQITKFPARLGQHKRVLRETQRM